MIYIYIYSPLFHDSYDKVYAFSLFDFTPKDYVRKDMITGGTGFDIKSKLPAEIEACDLDYSIFPDCDYSIIWFSRGCFRNCPFCVVREKEGYIHPVEPKNLNPNGKFIKVMDNNFFANPEWRSAVDQLLEWNQKIDMQGFDIRIFDAEQGEALQLLKHRKAFKFAWDNPRDNLDDKIELFYKDYNDPRVKEMIRRGSKGARSYDWWEIQQVKAGSKEKGIHPCQAPIKLMDNIIKVIPENYVVCDPFMGGGTTGVASLMNNRQFIGMELDELYFNEAHRRLSEMLI